jgi:hypothetical protein
VRAIGAIGVSDAVDSGRRWNRRPLTPKAMAKRKSAAAATTKLKQDLENALIRERSMVAEMEAMRMREARQKARKSG